MVRDVPKAWVKSRKHDRYYRAAKRQKYRSRAAIKLSQIDREYGLFRPGYTVVDLGAAPGGWSQIARERVGPKGRVLAVDLAPVRPIEGVEFLRGDFTDHAVQARIFELLRAPADVVLSDMAPHLSGNRPYDEARMLDLAEAALSFAARALRPRGDLLVKVFQGEGYRRFLGSAAVHFEGVKGVKPKASTPSSAELYVLARGRIG
ncbi:MAG TPA: RlmE family RNA methyltransferase [Thermoplasmata archaeon]|nr:RlmE family RNA methyltransferase [Thermoplasmata archaeon]